jgi:hypothetical protein
MTLSLGIIESTQWVALTSEDPMPSHRSTVPREVIPGHTSRHYTKHSKYRLIHILLLGDAMMWLWVVLRWNLPESTTGKCVGQIAKYWYQMTCLDTEGLAKPCYKCVSSWTMEWKEELYNI